MPSNGALFPIDVLVDHTPIIRVYFEALVLNEEITQVLPEQQCSLKFHIECLAELCVDHRLPLLF